MREVSSIRTSHKQHGFGIRSFSACSGTKSIEDYMLRFPLVAVLCTVLLAACASTPSKPSNDTVPTPAAATSTPPPITTNTQSNYALALSTLKDSLNYSCEEPASGMANCTSAQGAQVSVLDPGGVTGHMPAADADTLTNAGIPLLVLGDSPSFPGQVVVANG